MKTETSFYKELKAIEDRLWAADNAAARRMVSGLCRLGLMLGRQGAGEDLLPALMSEISEALDADRCSLFLIPWDWERLCLVGEFAQGLMDETISLYPEMGLVGACVLTRQVMNVVNAPGDPRFNHQIDEVTGYKTHSLLCAPLLRTDGMARGALQLLNKRTGAFTRSDEMIVLRAAPAFAAMDYESHPFEARAMAAAMRQEIRADRCSVFLLDEKAGELYTVIQEGLEREIRLSLNLGIAGLVGITGRMIHSPDTYADPRFDGSIDARTGYRTRSILCAPVKGRGGEVLGVVEVINKRTGAFDEFDMAALRVMAAYMGLFVENAIISEEYSQQFKSAIAVLAASIDAKDPLTAHHSKRVNAYAMGIARELEFPEADIDILSVAALLHDYGKIGTDERVLKKPGKLTDAEYAHVKEHVRDTWRILSKMRFVRKYRNVPLIAACHHERPDGSGYMEGIGESDIPFMAKIIAVADVFEALTARRHYREAMTAGDAFAVLDAGIGGQFDGDVVAALKRYYEKVRLRENGGVDAGENGLD